MFPGSPLPDDPRIALRNGETMVAIGAYPAARVALEHCIKLDPYNIRALYWLALIYFRLEATYLAAQKYNELLRMADPEAQVATELLRRSFLLKDGHPIDDVVMFDEFEAEHIIVTMHGTGFRPQQFATIQWMDFEYIHGTTCFDLSVVIGPNNTYLCTVKEGQGPLFPAAENAWIPVWSCSRTVFDRRAAQQLFFQRALLCGRREHDLQTPPMYCATDFPETHTAMLLQRVYPELDDSGAAALSYTRKFFRLGGII